MIGKHSKRTSGKVARHGGVWHSPIGATSESGFRRYLIGALGCMAYLMVLCTSTQSAAIQEGPADEPAYPMIPRPVGSAIRVATLNSALNRKAEGDLAKELAIGEVQIKKIATLVQCVSPDVLLINEIDFDPSNPAVSNAQVFLDQYLRIRQPGTPNDLGHAWVDCFSAPVNTGVDSGLDLNQNGRLLDFEDAWGYGAFPGQYGMALFSRFPIDRERLRTFRDFLWSEMPDALRPKVVNQETGKESYYHSDAIWNALRLSSKSHWDIPVRIGNRTLHLLASHPTPPVFDGPEDRNGCRNHDEIRMLVDLVAGNPSGDYLVDDNGQRGGLLAGDTFVVLGDLNADPFDGDGNRESIRRLLAHPRLARGPIPSSRGAVEAAARSGEANSKHRGEPAWDTGDFNDRGPGNLRVDYVLPSSDCRIVGSGVYWPSTDESEAGNGLVQASDHRLVWVDIALN